MQYIEYRRVEYYQNLLASMVLGVGVGCSSHSYERPRGINPGIILSISEHEIPKIEMAPRAKKKVNHAPAISESPVLVNTKRGRGIGSSRRSRHATRRALKALTC